MLEERFPSEGTIEDALKEGGFAALPVRYPGETFDEEGRGSVGVLRVALQPKRHPRTLALLWGRRVLGRQALPASWSGLSGNDWKERWQMVTTDLAVALPASPRNVVLVGVTRSAPVTTRRRRCNDCKRTQELEWFIMRVSAAARRQLARLLHD